MTGEKSSEIDQVSKQTQVVLNEIKQKNDELDPAYTMLQNAIDQYENSGNNVENLLPAGLGGALLDSKWGIFLHTLRGRHYRDCLMIWHERFVR
ncbi:hypothetical protein [Nitrosopumilus ureiphilus]|uniref:Uncharacterized protein n=1 Tax=Nitrosopumilus ureiphilus TaxID=1470067 RepID=A0A7D5R7U7_9ARCH|nr:hypothetical protein [Nitrosopumilus ureiphilus]QLH07059.1 hypothetical protein C5F50_08250 [Nitrosopumilus ureiphilus]